MESLFQPQVKLASKTLPPPLFRSIKAIFGQGISDCVLAGGTALAGFYAGHRRSDDIDLFSKSETHQKAAALAIRSLEPKASRLKIQLESNQYFEATAEISHHRFKITCVVDRNLFQVGEILKLNGNIQIVNL